MNRLFLGLLLVATSLACSHSRRSRTGVSGPGMNARREAGLLQLGALKLKCPEDSLVPAFIESSQRNLHLYRVAGCNKTFNVLLHCIGVCLWVEMPDQRAAQELGCKAEELELRHLDGATYMYSGCGKSAAYTHRNNRWERTDQRPPSEPPGLSPPSSASLTSHSPFAPG